MLCLYTNMRHTLARFRVEFLIEEGQVNIFTNAHKLTGEHNINHALVSLFLLIIIVIIIVFFRKNENILLPTLMTNLY